MTTVLIRTVLIYLILILALRLTGKRQIGELQVAELVVTFMLSELAVYPITEKSAPLSQTIIPIIILLSFEVIFSFLQTKSPSFRKFFCGGPTVIISKGKLIPEELAKNRLDMEEMLGELRLKGVFNIAEVEYAVLEENGRLSVMTKAASSPFKPEQIRLPVDEHGTSHPVIVDGKINPAGLSAASKSAVWLDNFLSEHGVSAESIFLMTVDDFGDVSLYVSDPNNKQLLITQTHISNIGSDYNQ